MPIHTAVFAALASLLLTALALLTTRLRIKHKIFVGYGDRSDLQRISRAHGVSFEHLLPMLLMLLLLELCGCDHHIVDGFGIAILASRLAHVTGFVRGLWRLRIPGMSATYLTETLLALAVLVQVARVV
jgi:uncharacterized membrane protein YecN with MAPEG domain